MKTNLKLVYFLMLPALCLYVAAGSVQAQDGGPTIINAGASEGLTTGNLNWGYAPGFSPSSGSTVSLGLYVECDEDGLPACSATVDFSFNVFDPAIIAMSLGGSSDDPNAYGTLAFYDGEPGGETVENWTVSGGSLSTRIRKYSDVLLTAFR